MAQWKEGDMVRIITRPVTDDDRKNNRYFEHMAGLTGKVENIYEGGEIAVKINLADLPKVGKDLHKEANDRMRKKFADSVSEEQRKKLEPDELNFVANYVQLVQAKDLEKV
ncbi:MAG: hypothetical protein JSS72_01775 [Armatimonadetes bacterium]|nr:hypothetical protein [Armatimonadota bacterium]